MAAWFQGGFHTFLGSYLRRHFHSIAIGVDGWQPPSLVSDDPLIVYGNHPSWWDPLIAHYLNLKLLSPRQFYAPIDASALAKYAVFAKLGFYGVDLASHSGAAAFLKRSMSILEHSRTSLWLTPEGRFCDCRDHTAPLMPGLSHLCSRLRRGLVVPMAIEYVFWEERLPECLVYFGKPLEVSDFLGQDKPSWNRALTAGLRTAQKELAAIVVARDSSKFAAVLHGRAGAGGFYDAMRRLKSLAAGRRFRPEHGGKWR